MQMDKPLTDHMIEILMDCHERQMMNLEPRDAATVQYAKGLILRGMVDTRTYITAKGKKIIAFYITNSGIAYLKNL
jgi:hypothetical protein